MIFVSTKKSLRIILEPKRKMLDNTGNVFVTEGVSAQFQSGVFETDDPKTIKLMKASRMFGIYFKSEDKAEEDERSEASHKLENQTKDVKKNALTSCPYCSFNAATNAGLINHVESNLGKKDHPTEMPDLLS